MRKKKRALPRDADTKLGLGALWGDQLATRTGWTWVLRVLPVERRS